MFPIAGIASLFGGGSSAAPAGPVNQTTGAITLGSKYLGRGSVTTSDTAASGGSAIQQAAAPQTSSALLIAGVAVVGVLALVLLNRGKA